jgi:4-hydroxy-tetrahydrodipicolinate reductase
MTIRVCVAGATGWAGSALSRGIFEAPDMELVAGIARSQAGKLLGDALGIEGLAAPVFGTMAEGLETKPDVVVEYTKPDAAKANIISALRGGAHVVVGTSGLSEADYREIDEVAREVKRGVLAAGNFALTAVLLQKFAEMLPGISPTGRSSTTPMPARSTRPAGPPVNWQNGYPGSGNRSLTFRWNQCRDRKRAGVSA